MLSTISLRLLTRLALTLMLLAFTVSPVLAQDDEEAEERDMRPASERFKLDVQLARGRWQLEYDYDTPESVVITNEKGVREVIWYQTFTVRNPTERRVPLRLTYRLITDIEVGPKGETERLTYIDTVNPAAEAAVEDKLGPLENVATEMRGFKKEDPENADIEEKSTVISYIEAGELRKGIVIFGAVDPRADEMTIYVKGLVDPLKHEQRDVVVEIKELEVKYDRPGDEHGRQLDTLEWKEENWIITSRNKIRERRR